MSDILSLDIQSEIGELEGVILHTPGTEVENMTPRTAQRALYSDILNLSIAQREYEQLQGLLEKYTRTYQVASLLEKTLGNFSQRKTLVEAVGSELPRGGGGARCMTMPVRRKAL